MSTHQLNNAARILLVEGPADKGFYQFFCDTYALQAEVDVVVPTDLPHPDLPNNKATKQGVLNRAKILLKNMDQGPLQRLGLVVDADYTAHGGGFAKTLQQVQQILPADKYETTPNICPGGGLIFAGKDGRADLGVWIMPNNHDEGMLEDWICAAIPGQGEQAQLLAHARTTIGGLPIKLFKDIHRAKAETATWLAWQESPDRGLYNALKKNLLSPAAPGYTALLAWLQQVFPPTPTPP